VITTRTVTGRTLNLAEPRLADIELPAIACGLARICRYGGQVRQFYSVAEHAILVAGSVPPDLRFAALHHDDSEAFLGDVSRNLKHSDFMAGYRKLEDRWTEVIEVALHIHLSDTERAVIKAADDLVAIYERCVLRQGMPWRNVEDQIHIAINDGWVRSDYSTMFNLATLYPLDSQYQSLSIKIAESQFLGLSDTFRKG
jgi:hypothetical protein